MIILYFHLQPQYKYDLSHMYYTRFIMLQITALAISVDWLIVNFYESITTALDLFR